MTSRCLLVKVPGCSFSKSGLFTSGAYRKFQIGAFVRHSNDSEEREVQTWVVFFHYQEGSSKGHVEKRKKGTTIAKSKQWFHKYICLRKFLAQTVKSLCCCLQKGGNLPSAFLTAGASCVPSPSYLIYIATVLTYSFWSQNLRLFSRKSWPNYCTLFLDLI